MTKSGDKFDALCEQVHEEAWDRMVGVLLRNRLRYIDMLPNHRV